MTASERSDFSKKQLHEAITRDMGRLEEYFHWLQKEMSQTFFEEIDHKQLWLIIQNLMGFDTHDYFCQITLKHSAIVLCLDSSDADLKILKKYRMRGIKSYRAFLSKSAPPFPKAKHLLRIAFLTFTSHSEEKKEVSAFLPDSVVKEVLTLLKQEYPALQESKVNELLIAMGSRFLRSMPKDRLFTILQLILEAETEDYCQLACRKNEDYLQKKDTPSLQIVLAWKNVPKHNFLYRLAKMLQCRGLTMKRVSATYIHANNQENILVLSLGINAIDKNIPAWEKTDIDDFLSELKMLKYFDEMELIEKTFVESGLLSGNEANLIKAIAYAIHQMLLQTDNNLYSLSNIEEGLTRHPEFTCLLIKAFALRFHPSKKDPISFEKTRSDYMALVEKLDTGNEMNDSRRKNVLKQALFFVEATLKTNFYAKDKTAFSFRLHPHLLNTLPYDRKEKFPELPFGIFYMKGMNYIGFHIRFQDLARGGLRTVIPSSLEQMSLERNNVFNECYNLAYTQMKKNKDIPEGGAKGVIFLEPYDRLQAEVEIYRKDLEDSDFSDEEIEKAIEAFQKQQKIEYLYQTQRSYIESFMTLINCNETGALRNKSVVDYFGSPEYIYLGPDENMHNAMIVWISDYSQACHYKPGSCFISSKPGAGINHKEFGVTSYGVNEYMEQILHFMGVDPYKDIFTVKMSGGPDGDVAGNQILNLYRFYPKTAKLIALTDGSGTVYDPEGLDLKVATQLFHEGKAIRFYPPEKLHEGGFLLDIRTKKEESSFAQSTLLWRKKNGKAVQEWILGSEMNHLYRHNVHSVKADVFIPAGGRPRTLNESNFTDFLDEMGKPTARAIVEGANLYLTPWARRSLEKMGVFIFKDSSCNKGGVICSSFEVLAGLVLSEEEFIAHKKIIMEEVLHVIKKTARDEAQLMLRSFKESECFLTDLSDEISKKINAYKYQILDCLLPLKLSLNPDDPLNRCFLTYCLPFLRKEYSKRLIQLVPEMHKKAIIACFLAARVIYKKGLLWAPGIAEVLPILMNDPEIMGE